MAVSAFPALVDALVERVGAAVAVGVNVFDGAPDSDSSDDFVAIGVPSIDLDGTVAAGSAEQSWAGGTSALTRDEQGVINCVAAARSQDGSVKDARDRAYVIAEVIATVCRTRDVTTNAPNLGVSTVLWCSYGGQVSAYEVHEEDQPVAYAVEFQIGYRARI